MHSKRNTCTCTQVIAYMYFTTNENSHSLQSNLKQDFLIWDAVTTILDMLQNVLKTVFMLVKFLYFVDNTAKCVSNFFCCKGTFGRTT